MKLSVIIPAYNEGEQICNNLLGLKSVINKIEPSYEIIVVSDGSLDNTFEEASKACDGRVKVYKYKKNQGKGFALKYGVAKCTGDFVTFCDADMSILPREIDIFLKLMEIYDSDIVIGSKRHPQSEVNYPVFRKLQSFFYQNIIRLLFKINIKDTQTGLKLFKRNVIEEVIPRVVVKRFAFDLECLVVANNLGYSKILEAPVHIKQQFTSTTNIYSVFNVLRDTAAIFYRLKILKYYNR